MSQSREQVKAEMPQRWATLAGKSQARVAALVDAIKAAERSTKLDRAALRDVLIAELESAIYHRARADGDEHQVAMEKSRSGRRQVAGLVGWA